MREVKKPNRVYAAALMVVIAATFFLGSPPAAATSEEEALQEEADRLTYEILELKARQRAVQGDREALLRELQQLDLGIEDAQAEMDQLTRELGQCQQAYDLALRTLYKRGGVNELEVLLGAREMEEMWEDNEYLDRIARSETATLERLKNKISQVDLLERELRDRRAKRQRVAESLDAETVSNRIAALEEELSAVNSRMRSLRAGGGGGKEPSPDAREWAAPAPGKLLERVPSMPPLADFERTGITYSGYTTSYGEEFDGTPTASGVIFHMNDFTCAHRSLPFGTWLLVTFRGRQVIVQVNDRGPFVPGRVLDLSSASASSIGLSGVQWTEFEILLPRGG